MTYRQFLIDSDLGQCETLHALVADPNGRGHTDQGVINYGNYMYDCSVTGIVRRPYTEHWLSDSEKLDYYKCALRIQAIVKVRLRADEQRAASNNAQNAMNDLKYSVPISLNLMRMDCEPSRMNEAGAHLIRVMNLCAEVLRLVGTAATTELARIAHVCAQNIHLYLCAADDGIETLLVTTSLDRIEEDIYKLVHQYDATVPPFMRTAPFRVDL